MIVGLLGGTAMASVAVARRTQSAFPRILAASNPSDVTVDTGSQSPGLVGRLSHLPQVRSAESYVALDALRALPSGYADPDSAFNQQVELVGSLNGLYFDQDRVIITAGRRANPRRPGEVVVSELTAHRFGLQLGQSLAANFYSGQQAADPAFNPMTRPPLRHVRLTITGIGVFPDEVVQDDIDRSYRVLATPALTRTELRCCGSFYWTGLRLARGARDVEAVQRENTRGLPKYSPAFFRVTSVVVDQAERAVRPESVAAAVFGLIAAAGAFVLATQAIGRKIFDGRGARVTLRAMGTSPSGLVLDAVLGPVCAVAAGTVVALAVAVAASPLAPLGQLHRLEPASGVSFDWAVLGAGAAAFPLTLSVTAAALAWVDVGTRPGGPPCGGRDGGAEPAGHGPGGRQFRLPARASRLSAPGGAGRPGHGCCPGDPAGVPGFRGQPQQPGRTSGALRLGVEQGDPLGQRLRPHSALAGPLCAGP